MMLRAVALLLAAAALGSGEDGPIWLVVGPPDLIPAIGPLAEQRRAEGFRVVVTSGSAEKVVSSLPGRPAFLLLVGDDEPAKTGATWSQPAPRRKLYRWHSGQDAEFPSDALLGDVDGDRAPDFAVGRIPARSAEDVSRAVEKILAFEKRPPRREDLRIVAWGGAPGYGKMIDSMATGLLVTTVRKHTPAFLDRWMISASPGRALCGWPPDQPDLFDREMRRGSLVSAIIAHASRGYVHSMRHEGERIAYRAPGPDKMAEGPPCAPLVLLACYAGDFTSPRPCLAEELFARPGGPVTLVAATTESHPLTNYYSGVALLKALGGEHRTIGGAWLAAQAGMRDARSFLIEKALKDAEGSLEPEIDVDKLKRDQALMYALLGDPATRLKLPEPLRSTVTATEGGWRYRVERPEGATRLDVALRPIAAPKRKGPAPESAEEARSLFREANAAGAFSSFPGPPPKGPWEGVVKEKGLLRLVATGPGVIFASVHELE
jgi:hypothetical protein